MSVPGTAAAKPRITAVLWLLGASLVALTEAAGALPPALRPFVLAALGLVAAIAPRRPDLAARLCLAIATASVALLASDLALRCLDSAGFATRPFYWLRVRDPHAPGLWRYSAGLRFDGTMAGDLAAVGGRRAPREPRPVRFATDQAGFRNPPGARAKILDTIVLGDSFALGEGTTQGAVWPDLLATSTGRSVYNLGVGGTGPWQQWMTFRVERPNLRPAPGAILLWAWFAGNDLDDVHEAALDPAELVAPPLADRALTAYRRWRLRSPLRRVNDSWFPPAGGERGELLEYRFLDGRPVLFYRRYLRRAERTRAGIEAQPAAAALRRLLAHAADWARRDGLRPMLLVLPSKEEVYAWVPRGGAPWSTPAEPSPFGQFACDAAAAARVTCLDLTADLVRASVSAWEQDRQMLYWRDDTHPNERGHAVIAASVARLDPARP